MKWIKTYEELSPETYRKVADKFLKMNKTKKYNDLSNHADTLEYGAYNIVYRVPEHGIVVYKKSTFTNPSVTTISYGYSSETTDKEEAINNWIKGDSLCINIRVAFSGFKSLDNSRNIVPFDICISLSQWYDGKKEYIDEFYNGDISDISVYNFFEETKNFDIHLKPASKNFEGLFYDRKSANKFKKILPNLIEDNYDDILDMLSIVGGSAKDFESILEEVKNIKVHNLYDDEAFDNKDIKVPVGQKIVKREWYYKSLI